MGADTHGTPAWGPPSSPGVEVLDVDISVRSGFPLTPQQQAFLGRGFWKDSQEECPHVTRPTAGSLPGASASGLQDRDGGLCLLTLRNSKRTGRCGYE